MQGTWDETRELKYHKQVSDGQLVYSMGGGIGIDRVTKWMLRRKHIGEVQVSIWPEKAYSENPGILK